MSRPGRRALLAGVALLLAAAGVVAAGRTWARFLATPVGPRPEREVSIEIPAGASARAVAELLEAEGIVSSSRMFELYVRWRGAGASIQAGVHRFERPLLPAEVLERLRHAEAPDVEVTLLEGWTKMQVARALAAAGIAEESSLLAAFDDPRPVLDMDPLARDLEGYLFPDTYRFHPGTPPDEVAERLVGNFRRRFAEPRAGDLAAFPRSLHEIVILASIVERETGGSPERAQVAGVFADRLAIGMRLQSDPTVIYARELAGTWDGNLSRADLERDDPYNTYTRGGLPPGPIGSPGLGSLLAVLEPDRTGALYFVSRGDGTHQFSRTLVEHNRAVQRYQRLGRR